MFLSDEYVWEYYRPRIKKCGNICTILAATLCLMLFVIIVLSLAIGIGDRTHVVYIDDAHSPVSTNENFLSVALDSSIIATGFKNFNMSDPKLIKLMRALSPAYLRIGGTMADRLYFSTSPSIHFKTGGIDSDGGECSYEEVNCEYSIKSNFTMNGNEWLKLNKLAEITGLEIIFDLNALRRFTNGSWDFENAERLIRFSSDHNLTLNWELGNEPNAYRHQFNYEVKAAQLGEDFKTLRAILQKYPKYSQSLLIGPDVTRPRIDHKESEVYLAEFLSTTGNGTVDAITWHQYYLDGRSAGIEDFLDPEVFDILKWQIVAVKEIVKHDHISHKPIWLGETSSAYGGGAPVLSDSFVSTFIWLDKLGISAKFGLDVVIRQSLFKGNYALINDDYDPAPDWWVSVLYKKLVGSRVVPCFAATSRRVRLYCQCTKPESNFRNISSVTIFGINISSRKAKIRIEGLVPLRSPQANRFQVHAYVLTTNVTLVSRKIFLNGVLLNLTESHDVPSFQPKTVFAIPYVEMPKFSLAFWVAPSGSIFSC